MTLFVFLGPSLPLDRARGIVDAVFLPPVAMGDLYVLLKTRAKAGDVVAIVDGLFEQVGAVWHKEILHALSSGVHVYGASSMGALRAAELHPFGMVGVGRIFEAYRSGLLTDDDDVAVAHATAEGEYRSLSTAMASLGFALADLRDAGTLSVEAHDALVAFAKSLPYAERSWGAVLEHAQHIGLSPQILTAIRSEARRPDAKADDAEQLLRRLADTIGRSTEPFVADFCFNRTAFWATLEYEMHPRIAAPGTVDESDRALADAVRAHSPHRRQIEEEAAILELAARRSQTWQPDRAAMRAAAANIAHRHRLSDKDSLRSWRAEQGLDDEAWSRLVVLEARRDRLLAELRPGLGPFLGIAARRAGLAADIVGGLDAIETGPADGQRLKTSLEEDEVDVASLQEWYVARCGPMLPDPESHALQLGFPTLRDFVTAIAPAFRASRLARGSSAEGEDVGDRG
jgi:hypothetical protein